MKFSYKLTFDDFSKAQRLHSKPPFAILLFAYIALIISFFIVTIGFLNDRFSAFYIFAFFLIPIFFLLARFVLIPNQHKRLFAQQTDKQLTTDFEVSSSGITLSNTRGMYEHYWNDFVKYKEDSDLILLYTTDVQFLVLPKELLSEKDILEGIQQKIKENAIVTQEPKFVRGCIIYIVLFIVALILILITTYTLD